MDLNKEAIRMRQKTTTGQKTKPNQGTNVLRIRLPQISQKYLVFPNGYYFYPHSGI